MKFAPLKLPLYRLLNISMAFMLLMGMFSLQPEKYVQAAGPVVYYVRAGATGDNNGTSWTHAYTDLNSAIGVAVGGDQIWVAAGTYHPTTGTDPNATFILNDGVAIYGGFAGTESQISERNPKANVTILSGEIGSPSVDTDNTFHVVTASNTTEDAVMDGFTITAGNARGDAPLGGGGMLIQNGSPTLANLIFSNNQAAYGGGMFNYPNASPMLTNVTFSGNSADRGGGIYNNTNSNPKLENVTFTDNHAALRGGGMSVSNGAPTLTNVTFSGNSSGVWGGALHTVFDGNPTLTNVTISGNSAQAGGGIFDEGGTPVILNSIIYNNIHLFNGTAQELAVQTGTLSVTDSIVRGGYAGTNVIDQDPLLGPLQDNGGYTQTMALGPGSAALDQLDAANCPPKDQRGVERPQNTLCDLGAHELDTTVPTVAAVSSDDANGQYILGNTITITVSFSEDVNVTGTPQLTLETGAVDRTASFSGGSGTSTLSFSYTVQSNDTTGDLDYTSPAALALNGGTIQDTATNNAVLTLPDPGQPDSLSANKNFVIDGSIPTLAITRKTPTSAFTNADSLVFSATFSEAVDFVDVSDFLINGTTTATITGFLPVDSAHYDVTVSGGDLAGFNGTVGLNLNPSHGIKDLSGNALPPAEPSTDESYTVDNSLPGVVNITRLNPNPTTASSVTFAVQFTEPVSSVDASDFVLAATGDFFGASVTGITGSGANYTVTVNTWYGIGTLGLDLVDDDTITDQAGNPLGGSGADNGNFSPGQAYTINKAATNQVTIGGVLRGSYNIPSKRTMVTSYAGLQNGPVKVTSTNTSTFFTSQRVVAGTSFNEVMGYPTNQLTTEYWFPWYDNKDMNTWILVGNASTTSSAKVDIYIGGIKRDSYTIPVGGRITPRFGTLQTGPVRVVSTNGVKIFTSERTQYGPNNTFNEVMGYPYNQFTTNYWFPWYDNKDMATWVLVGNPSTTTALVDIYIAGVKKGSYSIPAGGQITPRFGATQAGPVRVVSTNGVKIFSSERTLAGDSFNEVMGYPFNQLTTEYWYPWYDNTSMATWVLVGNPSTTTALVDIYIAGVKKGTYTIDPGKQINQRYTGINTGPVRVVSTNGVNIFTSERVLYGTSFNEVMGYPGNKLTTEYWFPWYDSTSMSTNILVGKP